MKQWILMGCHNAGFKPREGGPITDGAPWAGETHDTKGGDAALNVTQLVEMAKYSAEEITKLRDRTQQLLDVVMA